MGASLSWFAVRGKSLDAILQNFGLKNVGKGYRKTPYCGGELPSGWVLVIHGRHEFTNDEVRRLSRGCEVIACFVEEHVMVSRAANWKDGEQIWSVSHDSGEGDNHLDVEGNPPAGFVDIRDNFMKQQEHARNVDFIFSIPLELARQIVGYSHEESLEITFDHFVKPTFFQKLFGA